MIAKPDDILKFWFEELTPKDWFIKNKSVDEKIRDRFLETHTAARQCELFLWRETPEGRLAEILVLDQFSRNLFRESPEAFSCDPLALALAQKSIAQGADLKLPVPRRTFIYMPFMHSESRLIHKRAVELFQGTPGMESNYDFELKHKAIIDRFGRYPHRNAILGRISTAEEVAFLKEPGSGF